MNRATLQNNTDKQRYELVDAGQVVAFADYRQENDAVVLIHTEVSPEHGGKGYGSALARQALDDIRTRQKKVVPVCEFMAGYIGKHPEYGDLLKSAD
ncbi:GNAT family N-acetyltransferase [Noviherbaspirillum sp. UKPF54]|uniref:GNAT family N-acetyltransferase n=1 Tax=Noviherbaspirillum sp. UKPF54 TaxID=2601898 RepID=UPI0011B0FD67|nr:GNAT family N-acetyltransferase [Noviherbaspirillum sp. UKPF54]QDZ29356.1 N-acetyltransferase [Noviherbaspirillum sp. UKPF54]